MKSIGFILVIFAIWSIYSCSSSETDMKITTIAHIGGATGTTVKGAKEVPADGVSYIEIKVKLSSAAGEVWANTPVEFITNAGSFDEKENDVKEITANTDGDTATVNLYSTLTKNDNVEVKITFDDRGSEGSKLTKVLKLKFGNLQEGKKLSACHFKMTCVAKNLGAYVDNNIATECFIDAKNRDMEIVDVPDIQFDAEVGRVVTIPGDTPATNRYFYIADPVSKPIDVDPLPRGTITDCGQCQKEPTDLAVERCRCGLRSEIVNPRDSLVTIIAYANGEECFEDTNRNGKFDANETVKGTFLGEPFIDVNDNGRRDTGLLGGTYSEPYVESFGDPDNYDEEDGTWNDDIMVWTQTKILLTGYPHESNDTTRFEDESGNVIDLTNGDSAGINCGGEKIYYFFLMDEYMNPIATNESESSLSIEVSGDAEGSISNDQLNFNRNKYGFEMNPNGEIIKFNSLDRELGYKYIIKVKNTDTECDEPGSYDVEVKMETYPGLSNPKYPFEDESRTNVNKTWKFSGPVK